MTLHGPYNTDLSLQGLEPGDNPLEHEPSYNPLRHCYPMIAILDDIEYELAVQFQLQEHDKTTPIDFINPKTGNTHKINFFPKLPEIGLEPEWDGPQPNLESGYQIGENPYYLVPTVHRCKHIETGRLLSREAALKLMQPGILQAAIIAFRDKVENDPAAPAHLAEMLDMWDPDKEYLFHENDDTWESEEEPDIFGENEDEYYED